MMFWGIGYKQTTFTWSRFLLCLDLHYLPSTGITDYKKAALVVIYREPWVLSPVERGVHL